MVDYGKLGYSGAIAGAISGLLLKNVVVPILNAIGQFTPTVTAKLASPVLEVNVRQSLEPGLQTGLGSWMTNIFGISLPTNMIYTIGMAALGGAILFIAGGWLAEKVGFLKTGTPMYKTGVVIFTGSLIAALILGTIALPPTIGITLANTLIAFGINAAILAFIYKLIDDNAKGIGILPF